MFTFDVPRKQVAGYGDPHQGTIYRVPAVYVGGAEAERLSSLAAAGETVRPHDIHAIMVRHDVRGDPRVATPRRRRGHPPPGAARRPGWLTTATSGPGPLRRAPPIK